jgi:enoyl-CoA hydratase/carnithine racemase
MSELVTTQVTNRVVTIVLNRPQKKNALTAEMYAELADVFDRSGRDTNINCVLFSGCKDFCSGNDLEDFLNNPPSDQDSPVFRFMRALSNCPIPIVAAVDGVAVGIGTTLLLHCDFVYASDSAVFMMPFINLNVLPEYASSLLLPLRVGHVKAAEMLMLGESFDAAAALKYGLINRICDQNDVKEVAETTAIKLSKKSRSAMLQTKSLMRRDLEPISARMNIEAKLFSQMISSPEAIEAVRAKLAK